jgi:hypothetical protein
MHMIISGFMCAAGASQSWSAAWTKVCFCWSWAALHQMKFLRNRDVDLKEKQQSKETVLDEKKLYYWESWCSADQLGVVL